MSHSDTFFIKPALGIRVPDPATGEYLPEGGLLMPRSGYWLRRLKDGDVVEVAQSANPAPGKSGKGKQE